MYDDWAIVRQRWWPRACIAFDCILDGGAVDVNGHLFDNRGYSYYGAVSPTNSHLWSDEDTTKWKKRYYKYDCSLKYEISIRKFVGRPSFLWKIGYCPCHFSSSPVYWKGCTTKTTTNEQNCTRKDGCQRHNWLLSVGKGHRKREITFTLSRLFEVSWKISIIEVTLKDCFSRVCLFNLLRHCHQVCCCGGCLVISSVTPLAWLNFSWTLTTSSSHCPKLSATWISWSTNVC